MNTTLASFTDVLVDEICNSQPLSLSSSIESRPSTHNNPLNEHARVIERPAKGTGQRGQFRCTEEIDPKYRDVFSYPYFNLVQSSVIEDALYSDRSIVVCAPTGSGKTVIFEMAIVQLLTELEERQHTADFKIIYMAPVKALCTERLTEWYPKFTRLGLLCIEVTGDTDVDFSQLKPYKIIITTPEKWDMLTRRWRDHRGLVEVIKLFLIDEVHILNDETRGPVLEAVVSRMKTIENSAQSVHRIEKLQKEIQGQAVSSKSAPRIRFVAVSATVSNPEDVASWLGTTDKPAVFYKFGDECRPVKLKRIVEGYPCPEGTSIFKFDIVLNYKLWPIIQKYHSGKPTLIFCNTRKSVVLTAETLSRELTVGFNAEQKAKLTALASSIKNKKLQALVMSGVGCHHAGLLYEERQNIEFAFRNRDLPILITTTTLAMGVNLPAHLVIVKNTQQYFNGAYQEYSISTVLQMVGRAGRPQFDTEATAVIMTRLVDKPRYQALVGGCEPLQSYLHKRLAENLNSEAALGTVGDVAQCVQWLRSTFLYVRASKDPKKYLGLPQNSPQHLLSKKIEELCVKAMNGLASAGLITMDEASCIESTEAGRLMSIFYLDLETMKQIMKIEGTESLERLLVLICESHELADMHLRVDERRCLNLLNRNNAAATIRFPMKGKISTRQMKSNCVIQAVLGCLSIPDPSLNQEAMKIMRIADRVCKCLVTYVTRPDLISQQPQFFAAVLNSILLAKCLTAHLWENSPFVSKQLKGIGPTFSTLLASAGKVNFTLLEESHPRDLERIMNKGPPAGNVLRKQVGLLPKYQLTMIPVDEITVTIQLVLLNQSHLAENMDNLTAGDTHKSYIIVGDSNNNLLLLAAFKVRDLISIFDGTIIHEVKRKHNFEHKIFAHCVSSSFVGIDVQSEYLFNNLEPFLRGAVPCAQTLTNIIPTKRTAERQTCITDTFKERKRKLNPDAVEKSKEKRKRENALIENFKYLKKSFESASKNVSQSMNQQNKQNEELLNKTADECALSSYTMNNAPHSVNRNSANDKLNFTTNQNTCYEEMDSDEFIDEDKIDSILNEIESEMGIRKEDAKLLNNYPHFREKHLNTPQHPFSTKLTTQGIKNMSIQNSTNKSTSYKTLCAPRKPKPKTTKSNYNFIDLLERNLSFSDEEGKIDVPVKNNGFSDTIKSHIQKYLQKTQTKTSVPDRNIKMLLDTPAVGWSDNDEKTQEIKSNNLDSEIINSPGQSLYPRYEIKEILGGTNTDAGEPKSNTQQTKDIQNLIYNTYCKDIKTNNIEKNKFNDKSPDPNLKAVTPLREIHSIISENEHFRNNIDNKVKENDLVETSTLDLYQKNCGILIKENDKSRVDNCYEMNENYLDDAICVEEYNFKKDNNECRNNVASSNADVIMISPKEVTGEDCNAKNTVMNNHCSDTYENNLTKKSIGTKGSHDNLCHVVLDNKEFQNVYGFTNTCSDIVLKPRNQLIESVETHRAAHCKTLAIDYIDSNLYKTTKADTPARNPSSDIVLKTKNQLIASVETNRAPRNKNLAVYDIDSYLDDSTKTDTPAKNPCSNIVLKNRNQLAKNHTSHDRTLAIEDIDHNLYKSTKVDAIERDKNDRASFDETSTMENISRCNQAQCNKSIWYPSVFNDPYPSYDSMNNNQNISSNFLTNIEENKQKSKYVKRYTYSTSKIDVCTKQTPDYCVQVIKKVRVDLDITAIVSANDNSSQNYNSHFEEAPKNNKKMKMIERPNLENTFKNIKDNKTATTVNNEIKKTSKVNLPAATLSKPEFPMVKNVDKLLNKAKSEEDSVCNNIKSIIKRESKGRITPDYCINKNQSNKYDEIQISKTVHEELGKQENQKDNYVDTSEKLRESGNSPVNEDNKIRSILQKYSKILAKNAVKTATPSCSGINRNEFCRSSTTTKAQKPFKITDIHKLHATLPETIIDNKPEIEELTKKYRYVEAKNYREDLNSSQYTQCTELRPIHEIPEYESITDLELEPIQLLANVDSEGSKDYKIDQSMFDPKALLQSVVDDEDEIVPPPPEFCDGITYSPDYDSDVNSMADDRTPQLDSFTEKNMQYNESIFDDSFATNLTPSTEIETWNLSQESSWEPRNAMNLSSAQSLTVMRKNANNSLLQNNMSRQGKLGKFRCSPKKKLKIKK